MKTDRKTAKRETLCFAFAFEIRQKKMPYCRMTSFLNAVQGKMRNAYPCFLKGTTVKSVLCPSKRPSRSTSSSRASNRWSRPSNASR